MQYLEPFLINQSINTQIGGIMDDPFPVIDENNTLDSASKTVKDSPAAIVQDRGTLVSVITRFDIIEFTSPLE